MKSINFQFRNKKWVLWKGNPQVFYENEVLGRWDSLPEVQSHDDAMHEAHRMLAEKRIGFQNKTDLEVAKRTIAATIEVKSSSLQLTHFRSSGRI